MNINNRKLIDVCFVSATYIFVLVAFLLAAIIGLDKTLSLSSTGTATIGLWEAKIQSGVEAKFVFSTTAIVVIVFLGLSFVTLLASIVFAKKQVNLIFVILGFVLMAGVVVAILTSQPKAGGTTGLDPGWLFKVKSSPTGAEDLLDYSTGGIVIIAVSAAVGVSYITLVALQIKLLFKHHKK